MFFYCSFFLFVFPPVRLLPFTYAHPLYHFSSFFPFLLSFMFFPPEIPPLRMWLQPFSSMFHRIGTRAQESCGNLCLYSRPFNSLSLVCFGKNDIPFSVLICRPRTGGHSSKYRPSANKLLDLGDRIVPDTDHHRSLSVI